MEATYAYLRFVARVTYAYLRFAAIALVASTLVIAASVPVYQDAITAYRKISAVVSTLSR